MLKMRLELNIRVELGAELRVGPASKEKSLVPIVF